MPVKHRRQKNRVSLTAELQAWESYLEYGRDFFGDLARAGLINRHGYPDEARLTDAWQRLGATFLAQRTGSRPSWAERHFGGDHAG